MVPHKNKIILFKLKMKNTNEGERHSNDFTKLEPRKQIKVEKRSKISSFDNSA